MYGNGLRVLNYTGSVLELCEISLDGIKSVELLVFWVWS